MATVEFRSSGLNEAMSLSERAYQVIRDRILKGESRLVHGSPDESWLLNLV